MQLKMNGARCANIFPCCTRRLLTQTWCGDGYTSRQDDRGYRSKGFHLEALHTQSESETPSLYTGLPQLRLRSDDW